MHERLELPAVAVLPGKHSALHSHVLTSPSSTGTKERIGGGKKDRIHRPSYELFTKREKKERDNSNKYVDSIGDAQSKCSPPAD